MTVLAGWGEMTLALTAFFASHVAPARPAVRRSLQAHLGGVAYGVMYSIVSLAVLALADRRRPECAPHPALGLRTWAALPVPESPHARTCVRADRVRALRRAQSVFYRGARQWSLVSRPARHRRALRRLRCCAGDSMRWALATWSRTETSPMPCCSGFSPFRDRGHGGPRWTEIPKQM